MPSTILDKNQSSDLSILRNAKSSPRPHWLPSFLPEIQRLAGFHSVAEPAIRRIHLFSRCELRRDVMHMSLPNVDSKCQNSTNSVTRCFTALQSKLRFPILSIQTLVYNKVTFRVSLFFPEPSLQKCQEKSHNYKTKRQCA